jgi:hypothetical protein
MILTEEDGITRCKTYRTATLSTINPTQWSGIKHGPTIHLSHGPSHFRGADKSLATASDDL